MRKLSLFAIAVIISMAVALPVSAQTYKCKAQDGSTLYSDRPCPGGKGDLVAPPARSVDPAQEQPGQAVTPQQSIDDKHLEFRKRQMERQEAAAKAEQEQQDATKKADDCKKAQNYLKSLESGRRVAVTDETGASIPMDDVARQKAIEETRAYIRERCGS